MSGFERIPGSSKAFEFKSNKPTQAQLDRIREEEDKKELERKRLGLPELALYSNRKKSPYSDYEEEAELCIMMNKEVPENLEKFLLETKEDRLKHHTKSVDCTVSDDAILEIAKKYGVKL